MKAQKNDKEWTGRETELKQDLDEFEREREQLKQILGPIGGHSESE